MMMHTAARSKQGVRTANPTPMANRSSSMPSFGACLVILLSLTSLPTAVYSSSRATQRTSTYNNNAIAMFATTGSSAASLATKARIGAWCGSSVAGGGGRGGTFTSGRRTRVTSGWAGALTSGKSPVRGRDGARSLR